MTTTLPPNPPSGSPASADDGRARARVIRARAAAGNGHRTSRLPSNGHGTTRLPNGQQRLVQNPKSKIQNRHKPLFVLRYPAPRYRLARRRKGGMLRTILAAVGSTLGLFLALMVVGAGGTAWAAWTYFTADLPSVDQIHVSNFQSTKIYDRHGGLLWEVYDPQNGRRTYRPIDQIPRNLIDATLAAEDPTFYSNSGVDPMGLIRAVYINATGQGSSGASTVTMQLVRKVILPEKDEQSFRRKVREAILANQITDRYGKDKILELYLNEIYYGSLAYGVDAAAEVYFGKAPAELTLAQCAFLAGLPQSPSYYGEPENLDVARRRQAIVLGLMLKYGFITEEEHAVASAEVIQPLPRQVAGPQEAPHFVNYVLGLLNERYGQDQVNRGGLKVFTSIDLDYQHLAEKVAREQVTALQADGASNASLVAMNPRTGEIMAMLGSVDFNQPDWGQVNVATSARQPGSALKPIMYATALKQGYSAASMLPDIPLAFDSGAGQAAYAPTDYDNQFRGPVSMRQALANSLNIPAVAMLKMIGIPAMLDTAQAMGIHSLTDPQRYGLSVVLGGGEVTLLELTNAYGTFANGGRYVPPVALLEVRASDGKILEKFDAARTRAASAQNVALTPQQAYVITDILSDNDARTPLYGANSVLKLSRPAAAKTGTTNDYKDSWTMGYSPDLVTGVWVGNNSGAAMSKVAGARGAGPIWHNFMEGVLNDPEMEALLLLPGETTAPVDFAKPPNLVRVPVCVPSGLKPSAACPQVRPELFIAGTEPTEDDTLWQMFKVYIGPEDVKSPLLAGPDCAPDSTVNRPFLVLPPEYQEWAKAQPTPVGPPTQMVQCAPPTATPTATPEWTATPVPGIAPIVINTPDTLHPTPALPDDFPGAVALISAPRPSASVAGEVTITGSADANTFDYYLLEWGAGINPSIWTGISGIATTAVRSGVLGTWNTSGLPEGPYVLRLTLIGRGGETRQVLVPVAIELTKPTVSLTAPQGGTTYAAGDKVLLSADASGPQGVVGVEFYVDGVRVAVAYAAPYVAVWQATPGDHILHAIAYSPHNSSAKSDFVNITVGATAPATPDASLDFSILAPSDNSTLPNKPIVILVATPPNSPVTQVNFYVDGVPLGTTGTAPFQWSWTPTVGRHTILAIGYLSNGKELARAQTTVYINPLQ